MYIYIAYRDLKDHIALSSVSGGVPVNNDYRFTRANEGDNYLLIKDGADYAVSKEAGDRFIEKVLAGCGDEHPGYFPEDAVPAGSGKAAVIESEREVESNGRKLKRVFYYDMDPEVLFQMMEDLRKNSGDPLDARALMNYCYPNAVLPEGDIGLTYIYHGIYCKPENKPASVIQTIFPDKRVSCFRVNKEGLSVLIREEDNDVTYSVPDELLPEISEKVRQLCEEPAEAYVEHGNYEGYVRFGEDEKRIFTDPDKTLTLLKEIASKGEVRSAEAVDKSKYYPVNGLPNGLAGGFGTGFFSMMNPAVAAPAPQTPASNGPKCVFCGADVTGMKFCAECGRKAVSE